MVTENQGRPYWHVDAKWICGIGLALVLGGWLVVLGLFRLTERNTAIELAAIVVAGQFSREGLDSPINTPDVQKQFAASGTDTIKPFAGSDISISKYEIETEQPRVLRLKLFRQLVAPMYDQGPQGVAAGLTSDPAKQQEIAKQAGALNLVNGATHSRLGQALWMLGVVVLVLAAGLIYFSAGWGRLVSPGLVLLGVSAPLAILLMILQSAGKSAVGPADAETVKRIAGLFSPGYVWASGLGLGLLVLAGILKLLKSAK